LLVGKKVGISSIASLKKAKGKQKITFQILKEIDFISSFPSELIACPDASLYSSPKCFSRNSF